MKSPPRWGCVVLTMGLRPTDLTAAVASLCDQRDVTVDVVVVGNGWHPTGLPPGVRALALPKNVGIPAGRNAGVPQVSGEYLFFLDDDARLPDPGTLARLSVLFGDDAELGLVQPRVEDPGGLSAPRRWVPRLRAGDPSRSSDVTAVWEGAVAMRRRLFDTTGGWPAPFFYAHEGIDLAWAVWDAGYRVRYLGDVVAEHPAIQPTRHREFYRLQARNRVYLARRRLPVPLAAVYLLNWTILTLLRVHDPRALRDSAAGAIAGMAGECGARKPISWRTVWRMSRAGRPPII